MSGNESGPHSQSVAGSMLLLFVEPDKAKVKSICIELQDVLHWKIHAAPLSSAFHADRGALYAARDVRTTKLRAFQTNADIHPDVAPYQAQP
jgi:hypothetical protein